jgi:hypothetical protein
MLKRMRILHAKLRIYAVWMIGLDGEGQSN